MSWDNSLHGHTVRWHGTPIAVANATTYLIDNLTGGRTYYFSVTAVDNEGTESLHITEVSKTVF